LPYKAVFVLHAEALHHGVDSRCDLGGVWVTAVDNSHGETVGREEDDDAIPSLGWILRELLFDVLSEGFY